MGYVLIVAISIGVGVLVYHLTAGMTTVEHDPAMWAGAAPEVEPQAPPPPPSNFERLSISHDRLTWHDRIIGTLGRGATGTVYKAVDESLGREVALKILNPALAEPEVLKRFRTEAAVVAATVVSLPLLYLPAKAAFATVERELEEIARLMGANRMQIFWHVSLPLARRGILSGLLLAFARSLGEFGATVMVFGMSKPSFAAA